MLGASPSLDQVFHALSDPTRRGMVERLARGPLSVSELAEPLDMTLAAVVQHLQVLERSGVIQSRKQGRIRTCQIRPEVLGAAEKWFAGRRALVERQLDRLGGYLADQERRPKDKKRP